MVFQKTIVARGGFMNAAEEFFFDLGGGFIRVGANDAPSYIYDLNQDCWVNKVDAGLVSAVYPQEYTDDFGNIQQGGLIYSTGDNNIIRHDLKKKSIGCALDTESIFSFKFNPKLTSIVSTNPASYTIEAFDFDEGFNPSSSSGAIVSDLNISPFMDYVQAIDISADGERFFYSDTGSATPVNRVYELAFDCG